MLSFEHHVYFVNALIIIWLSHSCNILISLAIVYGNCVVVYEKVYNMEGAGQFFYTVPLISNSIRVSIHDPLDNNAPLPIPHGEMTAISCNGPSF